MTKQFFSLGEYRTSMGHDFTFKPELTCFSEEDYEVMARFISKVEPYYEVYQCSAEADMLVVALRKFVTPEADKVLIADIYAGDGQSIKKYKNRAEADMDRGKIKRGETVPFVLFKIGRYAPPSTKALFTLSKYYREL
jgi:hypothetical protein